MTEIKGNGVDSKVQDFYLGLETLGLRLTYFKELKSFRVQTMTKEGYVLDLQVDSEDPMDVEDVFEGIFEEIEDMSVSEIVMKNYSRVVRGVLPEDRAINQAISAVKDYRDLLLDKLEDLQKGNVQQTEQENKRKFEVLKKCGVEVRT